MQQQGKDYTNNWGRGPLFRFMPDEFTIVLDEPYPDEIPADPADPASRDKLNEQMRARYDALMEALNARLPEMAKQGLFDPAALEQQVERRLPPPLNPREGEEEAEQEPPPDMPDVSALLTAVKADLMPDKMITLDPLRSAAPSVLLQSLILDGADLRVSGEPWVILPNASDAGSGRPTTPKVEAAHSESGNGGRRLRSLHFFQVGADRLQTNVKDEIEAALQREERANLSKEEAIKNISDRADARARHTRDLVNLVNLYPDILQRRLRVDGKELADHSLAAIPNWLCDATCGGCPCPGSVPLPVPVDSKRARDGFWSFQFDKPRLHELVEEERAKTDPSDVIVAVLDTSPTVHEIHAAVGKGGNLAKNMLLQHVNTAAQASAAAAAATATGSPSAVSRFPITIDDTRGDGSLPRDRFKVLDGITVEWRDHGEPYCNTTSPSLRMDDHGLFITGIIHDIAPRAETHLIRALGSYGVTHTNLILPILRGLPRRFLEGAGNEKKRLIINLSLGWTIPPGPALLAHWLPETYVALARLLGRYDNLEALFDHLGKHDGTGIFAFIKKILDDLHAPIREVMDFLSTNDRVLIVASAGNDNLWLEGPTDPKRSRPEPRWPARYEKVMGVAAVGLADGNAEYSNRGDVASQANGIATFGGDAKRKSSRPQDLGKIVIPADPDTPVDAVIGIYSADQVMLEGGANETGWVYWSGTSFATPVITGIAADLWAQYPDKSAQEIIAQIADAQDNVANTLDTISRQAATTADRANTLDCPKIHAWQEWCWS